MLVIPRLKPILICSVFMGLKAHASTAHSRGRLCHTTEAYLALPVR